MSDADSKLDTARDRLLFVLPMLKLRLGMIEVENPGAKVMLGVLAVNEDGSGRVAAQIAESAEFLNDLAELLGVKDNPGWFTKDELEKP